MNIKRKNINEVLSRGVEKVIDMNHLKKRLLSGDKLRIKFGIDPTGPKIHLGRAIALWKLRAFQEMGHKIVLIIGDFTARIGDASDKKAMRKPLSPKEIRQNMKDYTEQIGKILNMRKVELHYNSEWLSKIKMDDFIFICQHFTAQQMIQRRNFKERWGGGKPIGLHELYYPILQGYDSVAVKSDLEVGGYDQLFNLKIGREIQRIFNEKPQDIMVFQMLFGLDGEKMSTSRGNTINLEDSPERIYGKIMSMRDDLIFDYFKLCTRMSLAQIEKLKDSFRKHEISPLSLKDKLAQQIISLYYSKKLARQAALEFNKIFREKKLPSQIEKISVSKKHIKIIDLLVKSSLAQSRSEARRLISQGGVKIRFQDKFLPIKDWKEEIKIEKGMVIQVGKRKFRQIK